MRGILLLNIGTPLTPAVGDVRKYLRQFLSDGRVVNLPAALRFLLLNCIILPFRSSKSAAAYREIWTKEGSPLLVYSVALQQELATQLDASVHVALGMRYGQPSIAAALQELQSAHCEHIDVLPLFPQYSGAATGSAIAEVMRLVQHWVNIPTLNIISDFYNHPAFIKVQAAKLQAALHAQHTDHVLFSYHGLPEQQVAASCSTSCASKHECPAIAASNRFCYRAQAYATSRALAAACGLAQEQYSVAFQSRLGKLPWIKPYTDEIIEQLYKDGNRTITVVCPSFVTDCLETLEEIQIRLRADWLALGGKELYMVPCLNADPAWAQAITEICGV